MVSGAVALLLEARPELTPDEVEASLADTAVPVQGWGEVFRGHGLIDIHQAAKAPTTGVVQSWDRSSGRGSLEASRGSQHVTIDGTVLTGKTTTAGTAWNPEAWVTASALGSSWTGSSRTGAGWG